MGGQESCSKAVWNFTASDVICESHAAEDKAAYQLSATPLQAFSQALFSQRFSVKFPYMAGAMANRIASPDLVVALSSAGFLSTYGSAGLALHQIKEDLADLKTRLAGRPFAVNLIHTPTDESWEEGLVEHLIRTDISLVEASAFMRLTMPLIRFRVHGIYLAETGRVVAPNRVIAKISRPELAEKFMSPPPAGMLQACVDRGWISAEQAQLAARIPVADTITVEADSGGHTDNRPALALFPVIDRVRAHTESLHHFQDPILLGLAGGISTPYAVEAAFSLGADFVVTGSINQACLEAGTSSEVKSMLASTGVADVAMAPAADMFEMGIKVQVLKRGTMFPMRAQKLYEIYRLHASLDSLQHATKQQLESQFFKDTLENVWAETRRFFHERGEHSIVQRADQDAKFRMALVFRSYLGRASHWANQGVSERKIDYQIWCGPAMGAFNDWARGSCLETPSSRNVVSVAHNLICGALALRRINRLKSQGLRLSAADVESLLRPKTDDELTVFMSEVE